MSLGNSNFVSFTFKQYKKNEFLFSIPIPKGAPAWHNYFLCGVQGIADAQQLLGNRQLSGMRVMVSGNIPPASGLSSSSALVSAAALATSYLNEVTL